jgi:hypothetical protein
MKKINFLMAAVVALSLISCDANSKYAAKGQELAQQLDQSVEQQDTAAALAAEREIHDLEQKVLATGDSAAIASFREAIKESMQRNAPFLTVSKVRNNVDPDSAVNDVVQEVMKGNANIQAVTASIDSVLQAENEKKKK